jgi:hypothetical protein
MDVPDIANFQPIGQSSRPSSRRGGTRPGRPVPAPRSRRPGRVRGCYGYRGQELLTAWGLRRRGPLPLACCAQRRWQGKTAASESIAGRRPPSVPALPMLSAHVNVIGWSSELHRHAHRRVARASPLDTKPAAPTDRSRPVSSPDGQTPAEAAGTTLPPPHLTSEESARQVIVRVSLIGSLLVALGLLGAWVSNASVGGSRSLISCGCG